MRVRINLIIVVLLMSGCLPGYYVEEADPCPDDAGIIIGRITDKDTGEPVAGVSVAVVGTGSSGVTDESGKYIVAEIVEGLYTLKITSAEHITLEVSAVPVWADQTRGVSQELKKKETDEDKVIKVQYRRVIYETPKTGNKTIVPASGWQPDDLTLVEVENILADALKLETNDKGELLKDGKVVGTIVRDIPIKGTEEDSLYSQNITLTADEIKTRPVTSVNDILTQVAVVQTNAKGEVFVRGGRAGEIKYTIIGEPVSDPLAGSGEPGANMSLVSGKIDTGYIVDFANEFSESNSSVLVGYILNAEDHTPMSNIIVRINGMASASISDSLGSFDFDNIKPGLRTVTFIHPNGSRLNLEEIEFRPSDTIRIDTVMSLVRFGWDIEDEPEPVPLKPAIRIRFKEKTTADITGIVTHLGSGRRLMKASVWIIGTELGAHTDSLGGFSISGLPLGSYSVRIITGQHSSVEIRSIEVTDSQTVHIEAALVEWPRSKYYNQNREFSPDTTNQMLK